MSPFQILQTDSFNPDFTILVAELDSDLNSRYQKEQAKYDQFNRIESINNIIVIYDDELPIACGAFKIYDKKTIEIKRMFVSQKYRRKGISKLILNELENWAHKLGYVNAILETGIKQREAIGLYENTGYNRIENYDQYKDMPNSVCYLKKLQDV